MWTNQIDYLLKKDPTTRPVFGGVFASDELPQHIESGKRLFVVNTDPAHQPGQHWVAFYFHPDGTCSYFDSYGLYPLLKCFVQFMERNSKQWTFNRKRIQHAKSTMCGHYCVFFAIHMCRGKSMEKIANMFDTDKRLNDIMVADFINHYFGTQVLPAFSSVNQCCRSAMNTMTFE